MEDFTRYGNTHVRHQFRNAGMNSWGPFFWGTWTIAGEEIWTHGCQLGVLLPFGLSAAMTLTRRA